MNSLLDKYRVSFGGAALFFAMLFLAVFFGILSVILPWWMLVAFFIIPVLGVLTLKFPEQGIVALLFITSGLIPSALTPQLSIGPGKILTSDMLIIMMMGLLFFKALNEKSYLRGYFYWITPVVALIGLTIVGVVVGKFFYGAPIKDVLQEARVQIGWLVVLLVVYFTYEHKSFDRLIRGLIFLGFVLACAVIAQFITGKQFIENARVENLMTLTTVYSDVTRSTAGGAIYLILFPLFYLLARVITKSVNPVWGLPMIAILASAVVVSFGRGIWLASLFSALILAYFLSSGKGVIKVSFIVAIGVTISLVSLAAVKPKIIDVAYERVLSTASEGGSNSSLGWRFIEANYAYEKIISSPVVGIGYGTPYKPYMRLSGTESDIALMRYIHNSYLGIWLKLGFIGLVVVFWIIWNSIRNGVKLISQTSTPELKAVAASLVASFITPVITSFTQPEWLTITGVTFFSVMIGMLVTVDRFVHDEKMLSNV